MISKNGTILPTKEPDVDALPACKNGINDILDSILKFLKSDYKVSLKIISCIKSLINGIFQSIL